MRKTTVGSLLALLVWTLLGTTVSFAQAGQVSAVSAAYNASGYVEVKGNADSENVLIQIWDSAHSLVGIENAGVSNGSFSKNIPTGVLPSGTYTVKAAALAGGEYLSNSFSVHSSGDDAPNTYYPTAGTVNNVKTVVEVTDAQIDEILKALVDGEDGGKIAQIKVDAAEGAKEAGVSFSQQTFGKLLSSGAQKVRIDLTFSTLLFDQAALQALGEHKDGIISIAVTSVDSAALSAEAQKQVSKRPVVKLSAASGGKSIAGFGSGSVKVTVPYTAAPGEDTNAVIVYLVDTNGRLHAVKKVNYDPEKGVLFSTGQLGTFAVGYNKVNFADTEKHWGQSYISFLAARGIIDGLENGQFKPDGGVTRAEIAKLLAGIADADLSGYTGTPFSDVKQTDWFRPYAAWAADQGIMEGLEGGRLAPNNPITREELAVVLTRFANKAHLKLSADLAAADFMDQAKISSWARESIRSLQQAGIIAGKSANTFDPQGGTTRAEAAKILAIVLQELL